MNQRIALIPLAAALVIAGCATVPSGPNVMVMPGPQKSFDQFQADESSCRQYASAAIGGGDAAQNAQNSAAGTAVVGTLLGAAAGAAIGAATGNAGAGAAWGAGTGLLFGSAQMFAARRGLDWKFKFHFGPYIAIAGVIALFWGSEIARRFPMLRPLG